MKFILIWYITYSWGAGVAVATGSAAFATQQACTTAGAALKTGEPNLVRIRFTCVSEG